MLFCHVTSRVEGEPHAKLLHERGGAGWPYVCFMNSDGQLIARQNYGRMHDEGVAAFKETLEGEVKEFFDLETAAKAGDKKAEVAFFMKRFELEHLKAADIAAALNRKDFLSKSQQQELREHLIELRTKACLEGVDLDDKKSFGPHAAKLLRLHKEVGLPEGTAGITAWYVILEDAYVRRDARTFELAFTALKAAGLGARKSFVAKRQKQLAELQAEKKK